MIVAPPGIAMQFGAKPIFSGVSMKFGDSAIESK